MKNNIFKDALIKTSGNLTPDQEDAYMQMKKWYNNKNETVFTLKGYAGTGKTYLLKYFLDTVVKIPVCVTAPTHQAVKVVEKATGRTGKTFQSLHGLRPNVNLDNFNTNNVLFDTIGKPSIHNYGLIVVDECGQVGSQLFDLTIERAEGVKVKILFVGDPCQLPPVKERLSKTFTVKNQFELTTIVRQEVGNPLLEILGMLRYDVYHNTSTALDFIRTNDIKINEKGEGFVRLNDFHFREQLIKTMKSDDFSKDISHAKYAAWTNASIKEYNDYVRANLFADSHDILNLNDLLTGYKTIVDEFNDPIIINSENYVIQDINKRMTEHGFMSYVVRLWGVISQGIHTINIVDHDHETYDTYYGIVSALLNIALRSDTLSRHKNWKKYYDFKDSYITITDLIIPQANGKNNFVPKELDYGYGLTIHKLQGSTVKNMFVNIRDITCYKGNLNAPIKNSYNNPYAIELRNKLLYTALSRASVKVMLLY